MTTPDGPERGRDRLAQRAESRLDREAGRLADHPGRTAGKWLAIIAAGVIGLVVFFGVIGFAAGWFNTGKDIVSPQNIKTQNYNAREEWNSLVVGADNACQASGPVSENSQTFLEDPSVAFSATYRRIWVEYNRRMDNVFEAGSGVVHRLGLGKYPRHVPDFPEAHGKHPDWCAVSEKLATIGPA